MKITICGSIAFFDQMKQVKIDLENLGHEVEIPPLNLKDEKGDVISVEEYYKIRKTAKDDEGWVWDRKKEAMKLHFDKVLWSDVILVLNYDKNDVKNYVGANTFLEMGLALHLDKKIFLYNPIPDLAHKEELLGMKPIVINKDLNKIV